MLIVASPRAIHGSLTLQEMGSVTWGPDLCTKHLLGQPTAALYIASIVGCPSRFRHTEQGLTTANISHDRSMTQYHIHDMIHS